MEGFQKEFSNYLLSFIKIGSVAASLAGDHLELALLELREEKINLIGILISIGIAASLFISTLITLAGVIVLILPAGQRVYGLAIITLIYFPGGLLCLFGVTRKIDRVPPPLAETMQEIKRDLECF